MYARPSYNNMKIMALLVIQKSIHLVTYWLPFIMAADKRGYPQNAFVKK